MNNNKSLHNPGFCPSPRNCRCCCSGLHSTSRRQKAEGRKPGPISQSRLSAQPHFGDKSEPSIRTHQPPFMTVTGPGPGVAVRPLEARAARAVSHRHDLHERRLPPGSYGPLRGIEAHPPHATTVRSTVEVFFCSNNIGQADLRVGHNTALGSDGQGPKGFSFVFLDLF